MGRPKRLYPLGKYRLRTPKEVDKDKAYPVELEYTWNRQIIRKTTNVFVKVADWNQNGNQGRGEIRASYGGEFKRLNQLLLARVERIDSQLAEYHEKHPNQITADVVSGLLADKPWHVVIREKILWISHWNAFLRIIRETESVEADTRTERVA